MTEDESMTTATKTHDTCLACGETYLILGTRTYAMLRHMINAGEITVGEARDTLRQEFLTTDERELLAGWVLDRADQGDDWKAGDPESLPCGCRRGYSDIEQLDPCEAHA